MRCDLLATMDDETLIRLDTLVFLVSDFTNTRIFLSAHHRVRSLSLIIHVQ